VQALAREISRTFYAASHGYSEIWLDAEKVPAEPADPIYEERYLPRKFKIGIAVPPRNDIDVFTQDAGLVAGDGPVRGRRYTFTPQPLSDAMSWMVEVGAGWDERLARLKRQVERA